MSPRTPARIPDFPPVHFFRVTQPIETPRRVIQPGQILCIDPSAPPTEGCMVMVGHCLEPWTGQADTLGVLTGVITYEDDEHDEHDGGHHG